MENRNKTIQQIKVFLANYWWVLLLTTIAFVWFSLNTFDPRFLSENGFIEFIGILFTVVIVDQLNRVRHEREGVANLISQLQSPFPGFALEALRLLAEGGLLRKGVLKESQIYRSQLPGGEFFHAEITGAHLNMSNFSGAKFNGAKLDDARIDESIFVNAMFHRASLRNVRIFASLENNFLLRGCDFIEADLTGLAALCNVEGQIREAPEFQLVACNALWGSIMPDGSKYDGRYNLEGDINSALAKKVNIQQAQEMAAFYEVSVDKFLAGQSWFFKNKITDLKGIISQTNTVLIDLAPGTVLDLRYVDPTQFQTPSNAR